MREINKYIPIYIYKNTFPSPMHVESTSLLKQRMCHTANAPRWGVVGKGESAKESITSRFQSRSKQFK